MILPADSAVLTSGVTLYADSRWLGRAQAVQAVAGFAAGALAPAAVGVLVEAMSGIEAWRVALGANAVLAAGGGALLLALRSEPPGSHLARSRRPTGPS